MDELILTALRRYCDGYTETLADGSQWASVYLDNARPAGMNRHRFAGYLSALERAGMYRHTEDKAFGLVRR